MITQHLMHRGASGITRDELAHIDAPPATETWFPLKHSAVLDHTCDTLESAGFGIDSMCLSVAKDNARFFGTLRLTSRITPEVGLAVGIRNSNDQSFPIGFCVGESVFVCDNLSFHSQIVISRKHTRFGETRFREAMSRAVLGLHQYQRSAADRIAALMHWELSDDQANSLILQSFEQDIIGARLLPLVIEAWRRPPIDDFKPRNGWSLLNAYTGVLKDRQQRLPQEAALQTIRLQRLLAPPMRLVETEAVGDPLPTSGSSFAEPIEAHAVAAM